MKVEEKTLTYKIYTNDEETEQIRDIIGLSIMNRRKNKEGQWGPWIPCDINLAQVIMGMWRKK